MIYEEDQRGRPVRIAQTVEEACTLIDAATWVEMSTPLGIRVCVSDRRDEVKRALRLEAQRNTERCPRPLHLLLEVRSEPDGSGILCEVSQAFYPYEFNIFQAEE